MKKSGISFFVICAIVFWSGEILAKNAPGPGTMQCRGVQVAIQNEIGSYSSGEYKNAWEYRFTALKRVQLAYKSELVNWRGAWCIAKSFVRLVPINEQEACGTDALPTNFCEDLNSSDSQIEAAIEIAIAQFSNPWGQAEQFSSLFKQTEQVLGCNLDSPNAFSQAPVTSMILQSEVQCAKEGVNYCGPGTSQTNSKLEIIDVPDCLNEACCHHDSCYGKNCVANECIWTPQSQECDNNLLRICQGNGDCGQSDLGSKMAKFVCYIVNWENGTAGSASVSARNKRIAEHPSCEEPASLETCGVSCAGQTCETYSGCNPGSGCESPVCATIIEGGGACVEGTTPCDGLPDCDSSDDCYEGLCFEASCCGRPVCVSAQAFCPDIGVERSVENTSTKILQLQSIGSCLAR